MPNTQQTPLNQQIQEAIARQGSLAGEIKSRYEAQPGLEQGTREQLFGGDVNLQASLGQYSDKVKELYLYDKNRSSTYAAPATTQAGQEMPVNPNIALRADKEAFGALVQEKEDAWKFYENRKNILGDVLDKAVKKYETQTKMKESDRLALRDQIDSLQALYEEENRKAEAGKAAAGASLGLSASILDQLGAGDIDLIPPEDMVNIAMELYGIGSKELGGTATERLSRAKSLVARWMAGDIDKGLLTKGLSVAGAKALLGQVDFIKDADSVLPSLAGYRTGTELLRGVTGPISQLTGYLGSTESRELRQKLQKLRAEQIHETYGGAFTQTEVKQAGWTVGPTKQETTNRVNLTTMREKAIAKLESTLLNKGLSQYAIDAYLRNQGISREGVSRPSATEILGL